MRCPCIPLLTLLLAPAGAWAQPYGFVTSAAENRIAVIDLDDDVLVGSFLLAGMPSGSVLNGNGTRLYVTRTQANSLASINTTTGAMTLTPVGAAPTGVLDGLFWVFVANSADDTVSVVNPHVPVPVVLLTIPVGANPLALAGGFPRLYVANWGDGTVSVIDTLASGMPVIATVPVGDFPAGLVLDLAGGRLYVANFLDDTVSVVDTTTLTTMATVPVCERPRGLAGYADRLYVACFESGNVSVIDRTTNQVVLQAPSGGTNPLDVRVGPDGQRLYVVHMQVGKSITVLDAATLAPLGAIEAPAGTVTFAGFGPQAPPLGTGKIGLFRRAAAAIGAAWRPVPSAVRPRRPAAGAGFVILDTEFDVNHWEVLNPLGLHTTTQETTGGNPGAWRRTLPLQLEGQANHRYIGPGGVWDPSVQGALATIDWTWDRRVEGELGSAVDERLLVFQGGIAYRSFTGGLPTTWQSVSQVGLTAQIFEDGQGASPDFSASGSPLTFGYSRKNYFQVAHGIDNFRVALNPPGGGVLSFARAGDAVEIGDTLDFTVERLGGTLGAVTVSVAARWGGQVVPDSWSLSWADGDGSPKLLSVVFLGGDRIGGGDEIIGTAELRLSNPIGGATIDRGQMVVFVYPAGAGTIMGSFFHALRELLLGGFSPLWILGLAVPAGLLAVRRRRHSRQARASAVRGASTMPVRAPASEP